MDKKNIYKFQKDIIILLKKYGGNKPLHFLSQDSCSELSRLFACWVIKKYPTSNVFILKGEGVLNNSEKSHDIILIDNSFLIDPSIWQFFKNKRSLLVGQVENLEVALKLAKKIYGGKWKVSEKISKGTLKEVEKLKKIITLNAKES